MLGQPFKAQCERRAVELRRRMGLEPIAPLRAADVAETWGVLIWSVDQVKAVRLKDRAHLLTAGREDWLGFTLRIGSRHLIVANSTLPVSFQNSIILHEIAHIMLGHQFKAPVAECDGLTFGTYNQDQEDEAAWLGSTLLLPRPALIWMRQQAMSDDDAATHFGLSPELLEWRVRMTGIDYQLRLPESPRLPGRDERLANILRRA